MRIFITSVCVFLFLSGISQENTAYRLYIKEVNVVTTRLMKDIGVQQTQIDTNILHENVALSMADVLGQNSTIFIKNYGRATLSTASFRGTSPSHTQVTWNGMKLNSPMLGMVDFSMIPSYFVDNATLLHGTSSVNVTGGGLGGAVSLNTQSVTANGIGVQYVQGIGSFGTYDEYARVSYGTNRWKLSTRAIYSSSDNDFKYTNYYKKENMVYDENRNLISFNYPTERNKNGNFKDFHILQEAYLQTKRGDKVSLAAWYTNSLRGIPMLNVDYKEAADYTNEQKERTFRGVISWNRFRDTRKYSLSAGYTYTELGYDYSRSLGNGENANMICSRSYVNTFYAKGESEFYWGEKLMLSANLTANQHFVLSRDKNIITQSGGHAVVGYDKARIEMSGYISAKYRPTEHLSLALALRDEMYGDKYTPLIPALFVDYVLSERGNIVAKASISRNYRYPTLNDLYFLPGGNDSLRVEKGFTYDYGVQFAVPLAQGCLKGEVTAFDSYIRDWIVWLPTFKGFWSPMNVKEVHAYGIEIKTSLESRLGTNCIVRGNVNLGWTPSINHGDPVNWADESIGKQLVYIPEYSANFTGSLTWQKWSFIYKWNYYSKRYTTSSNQTNTNFGSVGAYFMNTVAIEKQIKSSVALISLKATLNNIFNEEYESVLARPMPGRNGELFISIIPQWHKKSEK